MVHPFYFPDDESQYAERYMAANRNIMKSTEKDATYQQHPTKPVGYAWDTHEPTKMAFES